MTIISHFFLSFLSFSLLVLPFLFHFLVDLSFLFICDDSKLPEFILLELLPFPRFVPGEKLASYSFLSSVMQATVSGSVFLPRIPARCGTHFACRGSFGLPLCNRVHNICLLHSPNLFFFLLLPLRFFFFISCMNIACNLFSQQAKRVYIFVEECRFFLFVDFYGFPLAQGLCGIVTPCGCRDVIILSPSVRLSFGFISVMFA